MPALEDIPETPTMRSWVISHPDLDGQLVLDGVWSEPGMLYFGAMHIMHQYPYHDFGPMKKFTIEGPFDPA